MAHFILKNSQQNVNYYCNIVDFNYIICGKVVFFTQTKPKLYEKIIYYWHFCNDLPLDMNVTGDLIDCYFRYILMLHDPEISVAVIFMLHLDFTGSWDFIGSYSVGWTPSIKFCSCTQVNIHVVHLFTDHEDNNKLTVHIDSSYFLRRIQENK